MGKLVAGLIASAFVVVTFIGTARAAPVLLNQGDSVTLNYDLSASPLAGPFVSVSFGSNFDDANPLDPGERLIFEFFDSLNTPLLTFVRENLDPDPISGIGHLLSMTPTLDKVGHVTITADVGSVILTAFGISYSDGDGTGNFTDLVELIQPDTAIPEPSTLALLGLGLIALTRLRRAA